MCISKYYEECLLLFGCNHGYITPNEIATPISIWPPHLGRYKHGEHETLENNSVTLNNLTQMMSLSDVTLN